MRRREWGLGAVLGEIPAASAGMTDLVLRGCDGSKSEGTAVVLRGWGGVGARLLGVELVDEGHQAFEVG